MMNRIEAVIILSVSLAAGAIVFKKVAFPKSEKNENNNVEVEIDLDEEEVTPAD